MYKRIISKIKGHASHFLWNRKLFFYLLRKDFYKLLSIFKSEFKKKWKYWLEKYKQLSNEITRKKKFGNFSFYLRANDIFSIKEVFVDKDYSLLNDFLPKSGNSVIDLGAGIGDYALLASLRVDKKGKVISVESDKSTFEILVKNVKGNNLRNVIIVNMFVSSRKENSIDNIVRRFKLGRVDLLKMDIEGSEYEALKGAKFTLMKFKPKIIAEIHSFELREKIINFLEKFNYTLAFEKIKKDYGFYLSYFKPKIKV